MTNGISPITMPKNVLSGFFTTITMRANRTRNKIRLMESRGVIKGTSKDMTHDRLVNGVLKGKIVGSSTDHINGLFLPRAILPTL